MRTSDVFARLADPRPVLLCSDLASETDRDRRYRVPVEHRALRLDGGGTGRELDVLPRTPSGEQLRSVLTESGGLGLFAPTLWPLGKFEEGTPEWQAAHGSVLLLPPSDWEQAKSEFADWQSEGVDAAFPGCPYGFDDVLIFAKINFSPDGWLLVLRGPMAGNVVWWTHDGDSQPDVPWAEDIAGWGRRVWAEVPDVFGGVIRFGAGASPDDAPENAELYPERLVSGAS